MTWDLGKKNDQEYESLRLNINGITWKAIVWYTETGRVRNGWCWQVSKWDIHAKKFVLMGSGQGGDQTEAKLQALETAVNDVKIHD